MLNRNERGITKYMMIAMLLKIYIALKITGKVILVSDWRLDVFFLVLYFIVESDMFSCVKDDMKELSDKRSHLVYW